MGKTIRDLTEKEGHTISDIFDSKNEFLKADKCEADVLIEFSLPSLATAHISQALALKTPIVVGTTGWNAEKETVFKEVLDAKGALFHASNFSIGVNLFFELNKQLAKWVKPEGYALQLHEIHHTEKLDAPSGTAITTLEKIHESFPEAQCEITHERLPNVPGTHVVKWENQIDEITLEHKAKNRSGFALGAIRAAEFLVNKTGVFSMEDLLNSK